MIINGVSLTQRALQNPFRQYTVNVVSEGVGEKESENRQYNVESKGARILSRRRGQLRGSRCP
jgi:hypothetical protein